MIRRLTLTVEVDTDTEAEMYAVVEQRLRTVECSRVEFTDWEEVDCDKTAQYEKDLAYGGDIPQGDGWRGRR